MYVKELTFDNVDKTIPVYSHFINIYSIINAVSEEKPVYYKGCQNET